MGTRHVYHGEPTYIPPQPKSRQRGVNNNEKKEGYVFGVPMKATNSRRKAGYYHIYTKEGYEILTRRLQRRCQIAKHRYEAFFCDQCACFSGVKGLSPAQLQQYEQLERDYQNLHKLLMHARAQYESKGPGAVLSQQVIAKYGLDKEDTTEDRSRAVGAGCGVYAFAYVDAAGCGACGGGK
jgi:hypothetical protein